MHPTAFVRFHFLTAAFLAISIVPLGCKHAPDSKQVVLYTTVDPLVARPIIDSFEKTSGIHIVLKSVDRLALTAERANPQADVWWGDESYSAIKLAADGVLASYASPAATAIPAQYKDAGGRWAGTGLRVRVLAVTRVGEGAPIAGAVHHLDDLFNPGLAGHVAVSLPRVGPAAAQAGALEREWGEIKAGNFYSGLQGARQLQTDAAVASQVGSGAMWAGLCNDSDVAAAKAAGGKLDAVLPDQDGIGTLMFPCSVALVANGPNAVQGRKLVDYLLSREVEQKLLDAKFVRYSVFQPAPSIKLMTIDPELIAASMDDAAHFAVERMGGKGGVAERSPAK